MSQVSMEFGEARDVAGDYHNYSEQIEELLKKLVTSQGQLSASWEGKGFKEFSNRFDELKPKVSSFQDLLEDISQFLYSAVEFMEEADQKVANAAAGK